MLKTIKKLVTTILLTTITFQTSTIISHAAFTKTIPSPIQEIITYDEHGGYYVVFIVMLPVAVFFEPKCFSLTVFHDVL